MKDDQPNRNFIGALLLSLGVMVGFQFFFPKHSAPVPVVEEKAQPLQDYPYDKALVKKKNPPITGPEVTVETDKVLGVINLSGGILTSWRLKNYRYKMFRDDLMNMIHEGWVHWGWYAPDTACDVPDISTLWQTDTRWTSAQAPLTMTWKNSRGITFQKTFHVDKDYVMTVTQKVMNTSDQPVHIGCYSLYHRPMRDTTGGGGLMVHEGFVAYLNTLHEISYKDIMKKPFSVKESAGWAGMTDRFWLQAFISREASTTTQFHYVKTDEGTMHVKQESPIHVLQPHETWVWTTSMFLGPKKLYLLDAYEQRLKIKNFDLALDFGWFYFLTKPMYHLLQWLYDYTSSMGWAIVVMTVLLKVLFLPIALISHRSMEAMKKIKPRVDALKEKYAKDTTKKNHEIMMLYRHHKVNPLMGCAPMALQIPVFFALYKVLLICVTMRHAPFLGWIHDLSAADPTSIFTGFGLLSWNLPAFLHIGAWPVIMGITMIIQQRLSPPAGIDEAQAKLFTWGMPIIFSYMLAQFPAGLLIYWSVSNILTIGQQILLQRWYKG